MRGLTPSMLYDRIKSQEDKQELKPVHPQSKVKGAAKYTKHLDKN